MQVQQLFTEEEWALVTDAPMHAAMGITALDPGVVSAAKEFVTTIKTLSSAGKRYPDNGLICAIAEGDRGDEGEDADEDVEDQERLTVEEILARVGTAASIVETKVPGDAVGYKQLVLEAAEKAANASGGFLGFGDKVSSDEAKYLDQLRNALRM
jgi:hypothetical protein